MLGFQPKKQKRESIQRLPVKGDAQISPTKEPSAQAQELNQAPDSVPAMVKPGEFVLPADTVDAVGGPDALDGVVQATHTPAPDAAIVPQGFEPELFFSNGGRVPEDEVIASKSAPAATSPSNIYPQSHPSAGAPIYKSAGLTGSSFGSSGKLVTGLGDFGQQPGRKPAPAYPSPQYPANYEGATPTPAAAPAKAGVDPMAGLAATGFHPSMMAKAQRASSGLPQGGALPATTEPAQRVASATPQSPTAMFVEDAATDAGKRWDQGDIAGFAGAGARAALGGVGLAAVEALDKTVGAAGRGVVQGAGRFVGGLMGSEAQAQPTATTPAGPATAGATQPSTPAERQVANTAPVSATTAAPAATPAGTEVMPGVYSHGRGQYSDDPSGMGFAPANSGQPSAQSMRAANNLASNQEFQSVERIARSGNVPSTESWPEFTNRMVAMERGFAPGQRAPQMRPPTATHSGNDWTARQRLRSMQIAASSIAGSSKDRSQAKAAYQQALAADLAAMNGQGNLDAKAMEVNAGLQREGMSQDGANQRAQLHEVGADRRDSRRAGLDARRLGMEETAQGFQTRQARRIEELQSQLGTATTEQQRANIASQIRAMQGKGDGKDRYITMGGGQVWDANAGAMVNQPQSLFDTQSGQYVTGGQQQRPAAPANAKERTIGQVYSAPNGQTVRWTKEGWVEAS